MLLGLLLILILLSVGQIFCDGPIIVKSGEDYTFTPTKTGKADSILWKFKGNKVVEYENNGLIWYKTWGSRGQFDIKTGVLILQNLGKDDSGLYSAELIMDGNIQSTDFNLKVIDIIPPPTVTCEVDNKGRQTLNCSVPFPVQKFEWTGPDEFKHTGYSLQVPENTSPNSIYFCTATNEINKNSTQFTLKDCSSGGVPSAFTIDIFASTLLVFIVRCILME